MVVSPFNLGHPRDLRSTTSRRRILHTSDNAHTRVTLIYVMGPNTAASKSSNIVLALEEQSRNAVT